jgi:chromosome partitioning protein
MIAIMHTLVLNSQKGGTGKTTSSWNIDSVAAGSGLRVLMLDLDPQQSLRHWWERREAHQPQMLAEDPSVDDLPAIVNAASQQFDLLIIDTPPAADEWVIDVMKCADRIIIPVRASGVDLDALGDTINLAERARSQYRFLITQADVRSTIYRDTLFTLADLGKVLPSPLPRRTSHERDFINGTSGLDSSGLARNDVNKLWQNITEDLYGKGTNKPRRTGKAAASLGD